MRPPLIRNSCPASTRGIPRRAELLDACYCYLLEHGLSGLSLRPLAAATAQPSGAALLVRQQGTHGPRDRDIRLSGAPRSGGTFEGA
jgi:hypothetical protein